MAAWTPLQASLSARWKSLQARERQGVSMAAGVVVCALVWMVLLAPALRTLRQAPEQQRMLQTQLQSMHQLQAQARALQARSALDPASALTSLQAAAARLGPTTRVLVQGEQVTLSLQGASAAAVADWLAQLQASDAIQPSQVRLQRAGTAPQVSWSGTVMFQLPASAGASR